MKSILFANSFLTNALYCAAFKEGGWDVDGFADPEKAKEQVVGNKHYDVIVVGNFFPDTEGWVALVSAIKALEQRQTAAVMVITDTHVVMAEALAAGVDEVLLIPMDATALLGAAERQVS